MAISTEVEVLHQQLKGKGVYPTPPVISGPIALIKLNTHKKKKKKKKKKKHKRCRYMGIFQYCQLIALSSNV